MIFVHRAALAALGAVLLTACASPTVVQSIKPGDSGLSCAQLQNEFAEADRLRALADAEKSVTGGNVARAIFFWPAILGTAANANEAIAAAETRKVHLVNQMNLKSCPIPLLPAPGTAAAPAGNTVAKEVRLAELKKLFDSNLITPEVYAERQKAILDAPGN